MKMLRGTSTGSLVHIVGDTHCGDLFAIPAGRAYRGYVFVTVWDPRAQEDKNLKKVAVLAYLGSQKIKNPIQTGHILSLPRDMPIKLVEAVNPLLFRLRHEKPESIRALELPA